MISRKCLHLLNVNVKKSSMFNMDLKQALCVYFRSAEVTHNFHDIIKDVQYCDGCDIYTTFWQCDFYFKIYFVVTQKMSTAILYKTIYVLQIIKLLK